MHIPPGSEEQQPSKLKVAGSNPAGVANETSYLWPISHYRLRGSIPVGVHAGVHSGDQTCGVARLSAPSLILARMRAGGLLKGTSCDGKKI
jgi:hypothetical protein